MASRVLITAPTAAVVTPAEIRTMLGFGATDPSDDLLEAMIGAVVNTLDPAAGGWLGRALRPQTWELRLEGFCEDEIELPYPVLTELTSVKYDDSAGVEQTLIEGTDYRVFGLGGHGPAEIAPVYNRVWPTARYDEESVRIRYVAGYSGAAMPQAIKAAVALGVQNLRANTERSLYLAGEVIPGVRERRWVVSDAAGAAIERATAGLLGNYRVWG